MPAATGTSPVKKTAAAVLIVIAVIAAAWLIEAWVTENAQADAVEQAVSQFSVPETWVETLSTGEPGRILCLGGNACPSARIDWETPQPLTPIDMATLVADAGWTMTVEGDCQPRANDLSATPGPVCSAHGTIDDLDISIYQNRTAGKPGATVQLFVSGPR